MNILFWCDEYPPAKCGGIGNSVRIVAESLAKKGHNVYIFSVQQFGHSLPSLATINGVKIFRLTHFKEVFFLHYCPSYLKGKFEAILKIIGVMNVCAKKSLHNAEDFVKALIEKEKIDLIEIPDYLIQSVYFKQNTYFRRFSIPTIIRIHGCISFLSYYRKGKIPNKIKQNDINNFSRSDYICAVSEFSANFITNHLGVFRDKISVIYNPIESSFFRNEIKENKSSNNIVFIGKVTEMKGAFKLIEAFNEIAHKYPDIILTFLGGGKIKNAKTKVVSSIQDRVFFDGYVSRNSIIDRIDNSMFCVIPSYFETFGMAAMEVLARRKALIFTKRASGPELIENGINGLLVEPNDKNQIIDAMEKLITDFNFRKSLETAGYIKAKKTYSEEIIVSQLEDYYKSCIKFKSN